jgi:hypothetical protein
MQPDTHIASVITRCGAVVGAGRDLTCRANIILVLLALILRVQILSHAASASSNSSFEPIRMVFQLCGLQSLEQESRHVSYRMLQFFPLSISDLDLGQQNALPAQRLRFGQ